MESQMKKIRYFTLKKYLLIVFLSFAVASIQTANAIIQITDVNQLPWDERFRMGNKETTNGKLLFSLKGGGNLLYVKFNPGWSADGTEAHYHTFHEWGYVLDGDFPLFEFVSPKQKKGTLMNMRPGTFMDRPAYSIHGNRAAVMEKQIVTPPSTQLLFYEPGKTVSLNPENRSYSDEWKFVEEFFSANFQHTADTHTMEWEEDVELPGVFVKWLSDHTKKGFTAKLRHAPAGWSHPKKNLKSYNKQGYRFFYILSGDMNIEIIDDDNNRINTTQAKKDFFISQPPMSIWNWGDKELTEFGVTWLEVQYGKGTIIGSGPINSSSVIE
jgi:hypothetical protein